MKSFTIVASLLGLAAFVIAVPAPPFDQADAKSIGNGDNSTLSTSNCISDAGCASGCCAKPSGVCSSPNAAKQGCGFNRLPQSSRNVQNSTTPPDSGDSGTNNGSNGEPKGVLDHPANGGPDFDVDGRKHVGNGQGLQFITGQCLSDADCASGCCAKPSGICSGPGAKFQNGKQGCGFVSPILGGGDAGGSNTSNGNGNSNNSDNADSQNDDDGQATSSSSAASSASSGAAAPASGAASSGAAAPASGAASNAPANGGPHFDPEGAKNVGNGQGRQFIGGQCLSSADCDSGCCAGPSGICSGPGAQTENGKTGCGFIAKRFIKRSSGHLERLLV